MIKKNLGGDRIGTGNDMTVNMHGYERSNHNLTSIVRTTQSVGTVLPVFCELALPGDTIKMNLGMNLNTRPAEAPLFGSFKVEMHVFKWDIRLGIAKMHMNQQGVGLDVGQILFPQISMIAENVNWGKKIEGQQINPSSIFAALGINGLGYADASDTTVEREFNALSWIAYWEHIKEYYANKQEGIGAVIHNTGVIQTVTGIQMYDVSSSEYVDIGFEASIGIAAPLNVNQELRIYYTGTPPKPETIILKCNKVAQYDVVATELFPVITDMGTYLKLKGYTNPNGYVNVSYWYYAKTNQIRPQIETFPLSNIDDMRMNILADIKNTTAFKIDDTTQAPYGLALKNYDGFYSKLGSQEGLAVKTYLSDKFNNWLDTTWTNQIENKSKVSATVSGSSAGFTISSLLFAQKTWNYLNRVMAAGGTLDDWPEVTYDVKRFSKPEKGVYEGGLSRELVFEEIVSTAASEATTQQPLGTLGGKGKLRQGGNGGEVTIKVDETAIIMVLASITPRISYSQGNKWDVNLKSLEDLHKPEYDQIGFQDLITDQMHWADSYSPSPGSWFFQSAGKQPAWINYQTNIDRNLANFAVGGSESYMVLDRNYTRNEGGFQDLTTYIDPVLFNHIWAYGEIDAQNIWAQYIVEAEFRRKMSASVMPII